MRTVAACPVCMLEQSMSGKQPEFRPIEGELDDNGSIHVNCDKGHYGMVVYNARRYEVLVQSAASAFLDGYTNEVVAVMSSALERMYEFYIRVSCRKKGIEQDLVTSAWKTISAQSERQYGAFCFLYLCDNHCSFKLDSIITETRNKVVHRGKIIRETETLEFAEAVYSLISSIESTMQEKFELHVTEESVREIDFQEKLIPAGVQHFRLDVHTVRVDQKDNKVVDRARKFIDFVAAIHHARSRNLF